MTKQIEHQHIDKHDASDLVIKMFESRLKKIDAKFFTNCKNCRKRIDKVLKPTLICINPHKKAAYSKIIDLIRGLMVQEGIFSPNKVRMEAYGYLRLFWSEGNYEEYQKGKKMILHEIEQGKLDLNKPDQIRKRIEKSEQVIAGCESEIEAILNELEIINLPSIHELCEYFLGDLETRKMGIKIKIKRPEIEKLNNQIDEEKTALYYLKTLTSKGEYIVINDEGRLNQEKDSYDGQVNNEHENSEHAQQISPSPEKIKHECLNDERAKKYAHEAIQARVKFNYEQWIVVCDDCKSKIFQAFDDYREEDLDFPCYDPFHKEVITKDDFDLEWGNFQQFLDKTKKSISSTGKQYLLGKEALEQEGIDLGNIDELKWRRIISVMISCPSTAKEDPYIKLCEKAGMKLPDCRSFLGEKLFDRDGNKTNYYDETLKKLPDEVRDQYKRFIDAQVRELTIENDYLAIMASSEVIIGDEEHVAQYRPLIKNSL